MSLCRFSSDDFQCDVYVYESMYGWEIHVAAVRLKFDQELPPDVPFDQEHTAEWMERHNIVHAMVERAERIPYELPYAGESLTTSSEQECAEMLERLQALGYRVPQHAIDDLKAGL